MSLQSFPRFFRLCSHFLINSDPEQDGANIVSHLKGQSLTEGGAELLAELQKMREEELPLEELGAEANRWFAGQDDARQWLGEIIEALEQNLADPALMASADSVRDSNGTPLLEGDSVSVIKDLKVQGGSSDLKRGTLIKKIHLTGDPELIECRVDGSVLVLRTEFLKKS